MAGWKITELNGVFKIKIIDQCSIFQPAMFDFQPYADRLGQENWDPTQHAVDWSTTVPFASGQWIEPISRSIYAIFQVWISYHHYHPANAPSSGKSRREMICQWSMFHRHVCETRLPLIKAVCTLENDLSFSNGTLW